MFCFVLVWMNEIKFGDKFAHLIHNKIIFIALRTQNACIESYQTLYIKFLLYLFIFLFSFGFTFRSPIRTRIIIIIIMKFYIHVTKYFVLDAWRLTQPKKMSYDKFVHSFLHSRFQFWKPPIYAKCVYYIHSISFLFFRECVQNIYLRHDFIFLFLFRTFVCTKSVINIFPINFNIPINFVLYFYLSFDERCLDERN